MKKVSGSIASPQTENVTVNVGFKPDIILFKCRNKDNNPTYGACYDGDVYCITAYASYIVEITDYGFILKSSSAWNGVDDYVCIKLS